MRRIRRNVDRLSCVNGRFLAPERRFNISLQYKEGLLEVVTVRPRTTARRNVHVDVIPCFTWSLRFRISELQSCRYTLASGPKLETSSCRSSPVGIPSQSASAHSSRLLDFLGEYLGTHKDPCLHGVSPKECLPTQR